MQTNHNEAKSMQEIFEAWLTEQSPVLAIYYAQIKSTINWRADYPIENLLKQAYHDKQWDFANLIKKKYAQQLANNRAQAAQAAFEKLITEQSPMLVAYYKQIKETINWYDDELWCLLKQAIDDNQLDFIKLVLNKYNWQQWYELTTRSTYIRLSVLDYAFRQNRWQIIALLLNEFKQQRLFIKYNDHPDMRIAEILRGILMDIIKENHQPKPEENLIRALEFLITTTTKNPQLFLAQNPADLVGAFFNSICYRSADSFIVPMVECLIKSCIKLDDIIFLQSLLKLIATKDEFTSSFLSRRGRQKLLFDMALYCDKELTTPAIEFMVINFTNNPQMFGYNTANDLIAAWLKYCLTKKEILPTITIIKTMIATCVRLKNKNFLQLLTDNLANLPQQAQQEIQLMLNQALTTLAIKNLAAQHQVLQQQTTIDKQITDAHKVSASITIATFEQMLLLLFQHATETLPDAASRNAAFIKFITNQAAICKSFIAQCNTSYQNFAIDAQSLVSMIEQNKHANQPRVIILNNCAEFNPYSKAMLVIAPKAVNEYQVCYFSPDGLAIPQAIKDIIERLLGTKQSCSIDEITLPQQGESKKPGATGGILATNEEDEIEWEKRALAEGAKARKEEIIAAKQGYQ